MSEPWPRPTATPVRWRRFGLHRLGWVSVHQRIVNRWYVHPSWELVSPAETEGKSVPGKITDPGELQTGKSYEVVTSSGGESRAAKGRFVGFGGWLWPSSADSDTVENLTFVVSHRAPHVHMLIRISEFVEATEL